MLLLRHARTGSDAPDEEAKTTVDEPLDFYVKATAKDRTQKRLERVNTRPGALRRCRQGWPACAKELQRFQDKREHGWEFFQRHAGLRPNAREEFERKFDHKMMNGLCSKHGSMDGRAPGRSPGNRPPTASSGGEADGVGGRALEKLWEAGVLTSSPNLRTGNKSASSRQTTEETASQSSEDEMKLDGSCSVHETLTCPSCARCSTCSVA